MTGPSKSVQMPGAYRAVLAGALILILAGCAGPRPGPAEFFGILAGGAGGAILGSAVGAGSGQVMAVAVGTAAGAVAGAAVGRSIDGDRATAFTGSGQGQLIEPGAKVWRNPYAGIPEPDLLRRTARISSR